MALGSLPPDPRTASLSQGLFHHSTTTTTTSHGLRSAAPPNRPPRLLRCPFMRAFLGLHATFLSSTPPVRVISARHPRDHDLIPADLAERNRSANDGTSSKDFQNPKPEASASRTSEITDFAIDSTLLEARYGNRKRTLMVLGVSGNGSVVEMCEKLAIPDALWTFAIEELTAYPHIQEASILSTCDRFEVYVSAVSWHMAMIEVSDWMARKSGVSLASLREHLFVLRGQDAATHLFRVASGLDSFILGEGQILSQIKHVLQMGQAVEGFGRQLTGLFKQAVIAGKRVQSETTIGKGSASVSSAAVELAAKKLADVAITEARLCIIGAGTIAKLLVKHLIAKGCTSIMIVNRSKEQVMELQRTFPHVKLTYHSFSELEECIQEARVVFTCTASKAPLIYKSMMENCLYAAETKYFVDISVPRNVSSCVTELGAAVVLNVDDLHEAVPGNKEERSKIIIEALAIIDEEIKSFQAWQDSLETVPTVKKLRAYAERIRVNELKKCLGKMGNELSENDKTHLEELSRGIVNKLLHGPMTHLRGEVSSSTHRTEILENMQVLERMFDLNSQPLWKGQKFIQNTSPE